MRATCVMRSASVLLSFFTGFSSNALRAFNTSNSSPETVMKRRLKQKKARGSKDARKVAEAAAKAANAATARAAVARLVAEYGDSSNGGCSGHRWQWFEEGGGCMAKRARDHTTARTSMSELERAIIWRERVIYISSLSYGGTDQMCVTPFPRQLEPLAT